MKFAIILFVCCCGAYGGNVPSIPSARRTQYSYILNDGSYKYGFDTKEKYHAKQEGQSNNEVRGNYAFQSADKEDVNVEYTSGVRGFLPKGHFAENQDLPKYNWEAEQFRGNPEYNFQYKEDNQARSESSDTAGNIRGSYSYQDDAGLHELTYTSGVNGFKVTGGNLATPYSFLGRTPGYQSRWKTEKNTFETADVKSTLPGADGSYGFNYAAGDHSRTERTDEEGNVIGSYTYTDSTGLHEVTYKAGPKIGYVITNDKVASNGNRAHANLEDGFRIRQASAQDTANSQFRYENSKLNNQEKSQSGSKFNFGNSASNFRSSESSKTTNQKYNFASEKSSQDARIFAVNYKQGELTQWLPSSDNFKSGYTYEAKN